MPTQEASDDPTSSNRGGEALKQEVDQDVRKGSSAGSSRRNSRDLFLGGSKRWRGTLVETFMGGGRRASVEDARSSAIRSRSCAELRTRKKGTCTGTPIVRRGSVEFLNVVNRKHYDSDRKSAKRDLIEALNKKLLPSDPKNKSEGICESQILESDIDVESHVQKSSANDVNYVPNSLKQGESEISAKSAMDNSCNLKSSFVDTVCAKDKNYSLGSTIGLGDFEDEAALVEHPSDLTRVLREMRLRLEERRNKNGIPYWRLQETSRGSVWRMDDEEDQNSQVGCKTVEEKEYEFERLRIKLMIPKREESICSSRSSLLDTPVLPAIHRALMRSTSTPNAAKLEAQIRKSFSRKRRNSVTQENGNQYNSNESGKSKGRRRNTGFARSRMTESELYFLRSTFEPRISRVPTLLKSRPWASRESLNSFSSFKTEATEDDIPITSTPRSTPIPTHINIEASEPNLASQELRKPWKDEDLSSLLSCRIKAEPEDTYLDDDSDEEVEKNSQNNKCHNQNTKDLFRATPAVTLEALVDLKCQKAGPFSEMYSEDGIYTETSESSSIANLFDCIPHIDSSSDDIYDEELKKTICTTHISGPIETNYICASTTTLTSSFVESSSTLTLNPDDRSLPPIAASLKETKVYRNSSKTKLHETPSSSNEDLHEQTVPKSGLDETLNSYGVIPSSANSSRETIDDSWSPRNQARVCNNHNDQDHWTDCSQAVQCSGAVLTGGVSVDERLVVEVHGGSGEELQHSLTVCCGPASFKTPHLAKPRLLVVPSTRLSQTSQALQNIKAGLVRVLVVARTAAEAEDIREDAARTRRFTGLQTEITLLRYLSKYVPSSQVTSHFAGTLFLDLHAWQQCLKLRKDLLESAQSLTAFVSTVHISPTPESNSFSEDETVEVGSQDTDKEPRRKVSCPMLIPSSSRISSTHNKLSRSISEQSLLTIGDNEDEIKSLDSKSEEISFIVESELCSDSHLPDSSNVSPSQSLACLSNETSIPSAKVLSPSCNEEPDSECSTPVPAWAGELHQRLHTSKEIAQDLHSWASKMPKNVLVRLWISECDCLVDELESVVETLLDSPTFTSDSVPEHLQEETAGVVTWLLGRGEETLARHQTLADTLHGITRQETEFDKFYTLAKSHLEKGGSLLQEASAAGSEADGSVRELARALHLHLTQFTSRLHHTKDRLEDTARCYHLLDKAYEWALEAMKVVGRVKGEGMASPEQVGLAARALQQYLEEHPPIPDDTFTAMQDLATQLQNTTLLQQCKMAQSRCQETHDLLVSRQAALIKARRQMEFDCQSFVDLGEVMGGDGESASSPLAWLAASPLNRSGRRQSVTSIGSRGGGREPLSRCTSLDTDDDSVFMMEATTNNNSSQCIKAQLEPRNSLGGIKEVRESTEDLNNQGDNCSSSGSSSEASGKAMEQQAGTSGTSSCSSSDSCGPSVNKQKVFKRADTWQFMPNKDDNNEYTLESYSPDKRPVSTANSHLLIRSSQLNLSFNTDDLSQEELKKSKTLLMIMRELIQTERDYVNSLEYIIENYIPELMREDIPQAVRGQRNVIFGNIEKIYEFHAGYFLRALESCEMKPFSVGSIFLRYESQFYLYALYNKNKPKSDGIMSEYGTAFFRAKQLELEDRMDLASYVLKPVQRMGKYALILKQLLKECSRGEEGYEDLAGAADMVQFQLRHGNDLLAMDSLRDCDVNLKEQGRLLRQGEFVVWEGSRAKKSTRHIFLFEELILFSKARRDPDKRTLDIFQYKHSMKMTDMGLTEQVGESTTKFEIWFRKRKPSDTYLVQCANSDMKESWTEEISKLLWRQALRNRTMRLHEMSSMGIGNKPCLDIRPNRNQISDRSISINQLHKAPRLRSGSVTTLCESNLGMGKRPHSIISVSSSSASSSVASTSSSSSSSAICPTFIGTLNLGFEPGDSPRALHRSVTRTSQCSAESGIMADMYSPSEDDGQSHRRVERSNSTITTLSVDSALSPVSPLSLSPISATTSTPVSPSSPSSYYPSHPLLTSSMSCPKSSPLPSSYTVLYETPSSPPATPVTGPHNKTPKTLLTTEV